MVNRPRKHAPARAFPAKASQGPRFSPAFVNEVCACADVDEFVELMDARGIWMNRNAADGVYRYLRALGSALISDDDLSGVHGGAQDSNPLDDPAVRSALASLAEQLGALD